MRYEIPPKFSTLHTRLTFWNTAVLLIITGLTLIGVQHIAWTKLLGELDRILAEDALEESLLVRDVYPDRQAVEQALTRKSVGHKHEGWFAQVLLEDGTTWVTTDDSLRLDLPLDLKRANVSVGGNRVIQRRYVDGMPVPVVVRVGASLSNIEEDMANLSRAILLIAIPLVVLTPLAGYVMARRATAPLNQILLTASRLRPRHLEERLTVRGTNDELDRLSVTINRFLDEIAEHLQHQNELVANVAHDLRSPLAAMMTSIDVTLSRSRLASEYREELIDLSEECQRLSALVNSLLFLAKGDAGRLSPGTEITRLDRLVLQSAEMFQGVAEQKGLVLRAEPCDPVQVRGAKEHLQRVINNLLDNAVKYTVDGSINVSVRVDSRRPGFVCLEVNDTGIGIAPEDLPKVMHRFFRGDRSRPRGGHGLGLSISNAIVTACEGELVVRSTPGEGTCVHVLMPLAKSTK